MNPEIQKADDFSSPHRRNVFAPGKSLVLLIIADSCPKLLGEKKVHARAARRPFGRRRLVAPKSDEGGMELGTWNFGAFHYRLRLNCWSN
jgi:hypothetical protein